MVMKVCNESDAGEDMRGWLYACAGVLAVCMCWPVECVLAFDAAHHREHHHLEVLQYSVRDDLGCRATKRSRRLGRRCALGNREVIGRLPYPERPRLNTLSSFFPKLRFN